MKILRLAIMPTLFVLAAFGADVSGTWKASFTTQNGQTRENTIVLKADGSKLSGSVSSQRGESKIENGTVNGDDVEFTVVRNFGGNDTKFVYKGKVSGNTMNLHVTAGDRDFEMKATRQ